MALTPGERALYSVFGPMLDTALRVGRGAKPMWDTFKDAYANLGIDRPPASLQDMNSFRQWLGTLTRSMTELDRTPDGYAVTARHIAQPFGYTGTQADIAAPSLLATFSVRVHTEAGEIERWSSISYNNILPVTVGELREDAITSIQAQIDQAADGGDAYENLAGGTVLALNQMYLLGKGF